MKSLQSQPEFTDPPHNFLQKVFLWGWLFLAQNGVFFKVRTF